MKNLVQLLRLEDESLYIVATNKKVTSKKKSDLILFCSSYPKDKEKIREEVLCLAKNYKGMNSYEIIPYNFKKSEEDYFFVKFHKIKSRYVRQAMRCPEMKERELNF